MPRAGLPPRLDQLSKVFEENPIVGSSDILTDDRNHPVFAPPTYLPHVCFVGRLASYKYFNMDQAILNALEIYDNYKEAGKFAPKPRPEDFGPGDGPK